MEPAAFYPRNNNRQLWIPVDVFFIFYSLLPCYVLTSTSNWMSALQNAALNTSVIYCDERLVDECLNTLCFVHIGSVSNVSAQSGTCIGEKEEVTVLASQFFKEHEGVVEVSRGHP